MRPGRSTWKQHHVLCFTIERTGCGELEADVDQAIAACGGDMRATIRALIVANNYLESEVGELMKAVTRAYVRGRFHTYSG
jgi:hypothetical protein